MADGWDLLVGRDDFSKTELIDRAVPELSDGDVLLKVDRVGMTANNVTYALEGDSLGYWSFFPADDGWGRLPLWGYADVVESRAPGIEVGGRVYGYLPTSSHLVVRPERVGTTAFSDGSEHRAGLPPVYNRYTLTSGDPSYSPEDEDLQILYRPLFFTSFMLDDFLDDNDYFGAERIVMASASSKTGYGTAFCLALRDRRPRLIALTSGDNVEFTTSLGLYDEVVSYDELESIPPQSSTLYLDFAGNQKLRTRVHEHFGQHLVYDSLVGGAHGEGIAGGVAEVTGPQPDFFFVPTQIQKRREEWGAQELARRHAGAWAEFAPRARDWVEIDESRGPEGLREAWLKVLSGRTRPRSGLIIAL